MANQAVNVLGTQEAQQWQRLKRMRLIPLALLLLMAVVYGFTLSAAHAGLESWLAWIHAFAEAAMVGAMADWFAVTALFRHPLGLPIPHTAIVPRRKDEIGHSLAQFVANHFLVESALRPKMALWRPSQRLLAWLGEDSARRQLSQYTLRLLDWLFHTVDEAVPRQFILRLLNDQLNEEQLSRMAGHGVDLLLKDQRHQELLTMALSLAAEQLRNHRLDIRLHVRSGSPWWMPGFVDDRIVIQMLDRVENLLIAMASDPEHELRQHYHEQLMRWVEKLKAGDYSDWVAKLRNELADHPVIQDYIAGLWKELATIIHQASQNPESEWQRQLRQFFITVHCELNGDEAMQQLLDRWINDALVTVISHNRHDIVSLISDTIASWDAQSTAQLIELQIGADLQYIRINGTIVGGLIGVLLFGVSGVLGGGF